ncbi:MAG: hypothetical protein FWE21_04005 [Defluviitaleaceae bacterium]|nr:hypothetical protein [Defluviitaleaceae bacterium]
MDLFAKLSEVYKGYETKVEAINDIDYFAIVNPFWDGNIRVSNEDLDGIIFFFSFQHAHFDYGDDMNENINCLIEYINDFLGGKQVAVEFFQEGIAIGGGSRYLGDLDMSSGESLLRSFAGDNVVFYESVYNDAKGLACCCSIRGWNNADNKDVDFIL